MESLDVRNTTPPCAGSGSWFCGEYFTLENTAILCVNVCGTIACLYIIVITIIFRSDDLFCRFTLHLYIPFVPYSITQLLFIVCEYTSYFGPPIIDVGEFSPLTLVTLYFRFVVEFQYRVFINSIMFVTFLCVASPMKYRKLLFDRDLLRNFIFGHVVVNGLAGLSIFVICREWSPKEDPAFLYILSAGAFYFVEATNIILSFLTLISFLMAVVVMIVCRGKVAPNAVRGNAIGNTKLLVTLVIYSTPPTIANMISIADSVCECWYQISEESFAAMLGYGIYRTTSVLDEYFIMVRPILLTICTILAFRQYRWITVQLLTCRRIERVDPKRTITNVSAKSAPTLSRSLKISIVEEKSLPLKRSDCMTSIRTRAF